MLVGLPEPNPSDEGRPLFNTAALLRGGRVEQRFRKALLPTYDVFDEDRYFEPFHGAQVLDIGGMRLGISICEDIWNDRDFWKRRRYHHDPIEELVRAGAQAIVNLSASPFSAGKQRLREEMLGSMARKHGVPLVYVNQFGGNDDLVFDGRSCGFDAGGAPIARGRVVRRRRRRSAISNAAADCAGADDLGAESEIWRALVLGTRDYARKCGFYAVVLGLSGGIDSALTAAIAAEALGADHVLGVLMPSPYSSRGSIDDSLQLAAQPRHRDADAADRRRRWQAMERTLARRLRRHRARRHRGEHPGAHPRQPADGAVEQARRAAADDRQQVGAGGRLLHALRRHVRRPRRHRRRAEDDGLPRRALAERQRGRARSSPKPILTKAPSAELRPDQTDQDSLPPYDVLDDILQRHIERHQPAEDDHRRRLRCRRPCDACCGWSAAPSSSASRRRPD